MWPQLCEGDSGVKVCNSCRRLCTKHGRQPEDRDRDWIQPYIVGAYCRSHMADAPDQPHMIPRVEERKDG